MKITPPEKTAVTEIPGAAILAEGKKFLVKKAEDPHEIHQAQHLRYQVFKEEQKRKILSQEGSDCDAFDASSAHLLVIRKSDARVIGTCRLRAGSCLRNSRDFYSGTEYRFSGLEPFLSRTVEIGRSCIDREFRSGAAAALLWQGLAQCRKRMAFDYMLGCASLEDNDFSKARALFRRFSEEGLVTSTPRAGVRPGCRLLPGRTAPDGGQPLLRQLPPLFKGYLKAGAKVCGPPAFDRKFGSIDFPVWFDFSNLPEKYLRHFKVTQ